VDVLVQVSWRAEVGGAMCLMVHVSTVRILLHDLGQDYNNVGLVWSNRWFRGHDTGWQPGIHKVLWIQLEGTKQVSCQLCSLV
jgi:hypothetical protein